MNIYGNINTVKKFNQEVKQFALGRYLDSINKSIGASITKEYYNLTAKEIVVCTRDGRKTLLPSKRGSFNESAEDIKAIQNRYKDTIVIRTIIKHGSHYTPGNVRFNLLPEEIKADKFLSYFNNVLNGDDACRDDVVYPVRACDIDKYEHIKQVKTVQLISYVTLKELEEFDGSVYCNSEDVTIALASLSSELIYHPFYQPSKEGMVTYRYPEGKEYPDGFDIMLNDPLKHFNDEVYMMVGGLPYTINVKRSMKKPEGLVIITRDKYNKLINEVIYPIEDIINGSIEKIDNYNRPIVYNTLSDAINYGSDLGSGINRGILTKKDTIIDKKENDIIALKSEVNNLVNKQREVERGFKEQIALLEAQLTSLKHELQVEKYQHGVTKTSKDADFAKWEKVHEEEIAKMKAEAQRFREEQERKYKEEERNYEADRREQERLYEQEKRNYEAERRRLEQDKIEREREHSAKMAELNSNANFWKAACAVVGATGAVVGTLLKVGAIGKK
jgi:hypothetical protein